MCHAVLNTHTIGRHMVQLNGTELCTSLSYSYTTTTTQWNAALITAWQTTLSSPDKVTDLVGHLDSPGPAEAAVHNILHHLAGQDARLPLLLQQQRTSPQQLARLALPLYHEALASRFCQIACITASSPQEQTAHSLL